jgi:hypothetical protein
MKQKTPLSWRPPRRAADTDPGLNLPLEVFYVVRTTGRAIGKRHHQICPPMYETPRQAQMQLVHLQEAAAASDIYSVWKATTYVEPAEWLYDVVVADGSVIRAANVPRNSP